MSYFEEMQRLRGRQDNRTRQAQLTLDQIAGAGPTWGEIAVNAGQSVLGHYTDVLARAQAKKAAQAEAQAAAIAKQQALEDRRKEMLYGKVLDRGGALPEDWGGMQAGFKLPGKPGLEPRQYAKQLKQIGNEWVVFDPALGQSAPTGIKVSAAGKKDPNKQMKLVRDAITGKQTALIFDPKSGNWQHFSLQGKAMDQPTIEQSAPDGFHYEYDTVTGTKKLVAD